MASIKLNDIPTEIWNDILKTQSELKIKKKCGQYSQEKTVYAMLEDYRKIKDKGNVGKNND